MEYLEQQVRIALANDFAGRVREVYSDPGKLASDRLTIINKFSNQLNELVERGEADAEDALLAKGSLTSSIQKTHTTEHIMSQVADYWTKSKKTYEQHLGPMIEHLAKVATDSEVPLVDAVNRLYHTLLETTQRRDNIVNSIVKKVETI